MVRTYQLTSTAVPKRLSDVYGGAAGAIDASTDIPYREIHIQSDAAVRLGDTAAKAATGFPIGVAGVVVLGPFSNHGPVKLSDLWVVGVATIGILGVPY